VGDWRFSSSLGAWRAVLDADFILVSQFIDGRNTTGRELMAFVGGGPIAVPDAIACIVQLDTARIVWCNLKDTRKEMESDLTLRADAQSQVDSLLDEMLLAGDAAPIEPPPTGGPSVKATPDGDPGPPVAIHADAKLPAP
jgi:hypothetical protein